MGLFDKKFDLKLGSLFLKDSAAFTNMMLNGLPAQLNVPVSAPQLNFDSTEFDPNAGRLEAYNKRWNAYLNTLAKDNNKINVKKARKYFDSQFELDWENGYADRFSNAMDRSMENLKASSMDLVSKNYEDNGYVFDGTNWVPSEKLSKPIIPQLSITPQLSALTPSGHSMYWWLKEAQKVNPNFKSIEDVMNWLKENGLAEVDGKFGKNSLAKWNELAANKKKFDEEQTLAALDSAKALGISEEESLTGVKPNDDWGSSSKYKSVLQLSPEELKKFQESENNKNTNEQYKKLSLDPNQNRFMRFIYGLLGDPMFLGKNENPLESAPVVYTPVTKISGIKPVISYATSGKNVGQKLLEANKLLPKSINLGDGISLSFKDGGNIKEFKQGGNMENQEELQLAFMSYLIDDAQSQGIQIQSEQDMLAYVEQLGEEGLKAKYQEFMQKMQGGQIAKLGAKLNYIKKLKGDCPEGQELVYFKKGGRVCKICQGKKVEKGGKADPIKEWKALRKNKKLDQASKDSIAVNKFGDQDVMNNKPGNYKKGVWTPDRTKAPYKKK